MKRRTCLKALVAGAGPVALGAAESIPSHSTARGPFRGPGQGEGNAPQLRDHLPPGGDEVSRLH